MGSSSYPTLWRKIKFRSQSVPVFPLNSFTINRLHAKFSPLISEGLLVCLYCSTEYEFAKYIFDFRILKAHLLRFKWNGFKYKYF